MTILLHRSNATECLVADLARQLLLSAPSDPMAVIPIVVGSRGMERWLRHQLATAHGVAAGLAFPFPRQAFDAALAWLDAPAQDQPFWAQSSAAAELGLDGLTFALLPLLRARLGQAEFATVARYLGEPEAKSPVELRELAFAKQVAEVLDRLIHDRGVDTRAWLVDPDAAPEPHRWLAKLLEDVSALPGLAARLPRSRLSPKNARPDAVLHVFGLSTMGPGELDRLALIAAHMDVHLYLLAPSHVWWQDMRTKRELARALRKARSPAERQAAEEAVAVGNPLLSALGGPSRDVQAWLEETGYQLDSTEQAPSPADPTWLQRWQGWVAAAGMLPDPEDAPCPPDESVQFHAHFGPARQVEGLRDTLLGLFLADPTLTPRDVLVMTPDLPTFAPMIAAVFARHGQSVEGGPLPAIPVAIADLGLAQTNPVADVLLRVLRLVDERITASLLLELLGQPPVRLRLELSEDDVSTLAELVEASGMRWAFDAADRHAHADQPELDQNTLRFGLERLALGVLLPDEAALGVVPGPPMPLVPLPVSGRDRVALVGTLVGFVRRLQGFTSGLAAPRSVAHWVEALTDVVQTLCGTDKKTRWQLGEVLEVLARVQSDAEGTGLPITQTAILRWLQGRFELGQRGDRAATGAVTVCALEPMRSVPFRVVALIGMDDQVFPRAASRPAWDPFALERRSGEHDRRDVDRHLLLEAMLSARGVLWVGWSGRDPRTGKELPAAVPVEELLDIAERLTGTDRRALVTHHPLQPWSAECFAAGSPTSFDARLLAGARTVLGVQHGVTTPQALGLGRAEDAELATAAELPQTLSAAELVVGLLDPHALLLTTRMGLRPPEGTVELADREPLELDSLSGWGERKRLVETLLSALLAEDAGDPEQILANALAHAAGRGELPLAAGGRAALAVELEGAQALVARLQRLGGTPCAGVRLEVQVDGGVRVSSEPPWVHESAGELAAQWASPSKSLPQRDLLTAWVTLLVARAAGVPLHLARVICAAKEERRAEAYLIPPDAPSAIAHLADLLEIWQEAQRRPLPLFRNGSQQLATVVSGTPDADVGVVAGTLAASWAAKPGASGDGEKWATATLFPDPDWQVLAAAEGPWSARGLAIRLWGPLLAATRTGAAPEVAPWLSAREEAP